jgi:hypothetical protein
MNKEQEALLKTIDIMIEQKIKNLGFNYYVDGTVKKVNNDNTYDVLINGAEYKNIPSENKLSYSINDVVQVLIKNGNWSKKFIADMSNHTKFPTAKQFNSVDKSGVEYPLITDNTTNLWIGAEERKSRHHHGKTILSSGYDTDLQKGYDTIGVAVPNETNDDGKVYNIIHNGILIDYVYPIGSICIRETKSDPVDTLGGTWTLVDKEFMSLKDDDSSNIYFTPNADAISACQVRVSRAGHSLTIKLYLTMTEGVSIADGTINLGTFNYETLGITKFPTNRSFPVGYSDGGNSIMMGYINSDTGKLDVVDIVGADSVSGTTIYFDFTETLISGFMLNSACDKFYWKRKA